MLLYMIYSVPNIYFTYFLLVLVRYADCEHSFESEICLEQALTIHAHLKENICPYELLEAKKGTIDCSVWCKGKYTTNPEYVACVNYNISFHINKTLTTKLKDVACSIKSCIVKVIDFDCVFTADEENTSQQTAKDGSCIEAVTSVGISLSCLVAGSLLGISCFVLVKRLRTTKRKLQLPPVFYQPNYGDGGECLEDRAFNIANPMETEYTDIEETIRMVAKAIQVPSYKEDSSSETRSRENIYHHLSLIEDSTEKQNSAFSDSVPDIFADDMILSNKGSPSLKSYVKCTESLSSKSSGSSKASPTGSAGSDKYYALENEYLKANSKNSNT
ncbi:uncharacterized protein LOC128160496 [Crassostrea angulata]|uniref:uncharacterized protein LOC128160496 n=1 Tax=Magallana angulata TaxID=2784310 RepID=UPI0022B210F6|nr:uncharacterized protein LOC128160496 [Crassostrea angulata]